MNDWTILYTKEERGGEIINKGHLCSVLNWKNMENLEKSLRWAIEFLGLIIKYFDWNLRKFIDNHTDFKSKEFMNKSFNYLKNFFKIENEDNISSLKTAIENYEKKSEKSNVYDGLLEAFRIFSVQIIIIERKIEKLIDEVKYNTYGLLES